LEVWCKADYNVPYDIVLLHPVLQEIIKEIYYDAKVPCGEYLYEPIEQVYVIFQQLDKGSKSKLAWMYIENNCIEDLCCQTAGTGATDYDDLRVYHESLP
jgi:hypothetical protein